MPDPLLDPTLDPVAAATARAASKQFRTQADEHGPREDMTEREFWQAAYLAAIRIGEDVNDRAETADIALTHFRQRRSGQHAEDSGPRP